MHVLLIEPNPELREAFAEALGAAGFPSVVASDWELALQAAREERPAMVVVDASLEPVAAARFVHDLRRDGALGEIPVAGIAFRFGSERGILGAGIQCCLQKLPTPDEVVRAVRWVATVYGAPPA